MRWEHGGQGSIIGWALLSLAFVHAAWRLAVEPHVWDKTPHDRDDQMPELTVVALDAGREAA